MTGDLQQPYTLKHPKCQNLKAPPEQTQPFANNNDSSDAEVLLGAPGPCHPGRHSSDHAILTAPPRMMNIGFCSGIRPAIRHNQPARCTPTNALHPDERNAPRRTPCTPTSATHPDERNAPRRARRTPTNATPHGPTPTSPKRKRRVPRSASDVPDHTSHARTAHRAVPHERPAPRRTRRHMGPPQRARSASAGSRGAPATYQTTLHTHALLTEQCHTSALHPDERDATRAHPDERDATRVLGSLAGWLDLSLLRSSRCQGGQGGPADGGEGGGGGGGRHLGSHVVHEVAPGAHRAEHGGIRDGRALIAIDAAA